MASSGASGFEVMMTGAGVAAGPGGFGSGWSSGEVLAGAIVGGRRKIVG